MWPRICDIPEYSLAKFVSVNEGIFDCRDEAIERFSSLQFTLRGRAFELIYGKRKSMEGDRTSARAGSRL